MLADLKYINIKYYETALHNIADINKNDNKLEIQEVLYNNFITLRLDSSNTSLVNICNKNNINIPNNSLTVVENNFNNSNTLWVSPDEFIIICDQQTKNNIFNNLKLDLQNYFAAVIDNSGGFVHVKISGCHAESLLSKCAFYNFDPSYFINNKVVTTNIANSPAHIYKFNNDFYILLRSSFAASALKLIFYNAKEFRYSFFRCNNLQTN